MRDEALERQDGDDDRGCCELHEADDDDDDDDDKKDDCAALLRLWRVLNDISSTEELSASLDDESPPTTSPSATS